MDLPHQPRTIAQLQSEVSVLVAEFHQFVDSIGTFELTSHITKKRSGSKIELAFWAPVGQYCLCEKKIKGCKELQHGSFPFRNILHRVQSDLTLEYFRIALEHEKVYYQKFQKLW
jgi:hypothetical protein